MACGYARTPLGVALYVGSADEAVTSENELAVRVPYQQLAARYGHRVEFVDVAFFARTAAGAAECDFSQTSYFAHGVGGIEHVHHIQFVAALVGIAQKALRRKFGFNQRGVDRFYYRLIHNSSYLDGSE